MSNMDRRTFLKGVGGTSVALSVAGCSELTGGNEGGNTLVPGTASGFPPFEFVNEDGDLVGFDIDLLSAVVEQTDYELGGWEDLEFGQLTTALSNDRIDVIAAAMSINDERDQNMDFTDPYYDANQAILVREDGDFQPSSPEDLADHPIGAQSGTTGANQMQALVEDGTISESQSTTYENYVLAIEDLVNGNIDAVIIDTPVAETFVQDRPVAVAFTIQTDEQYGFGVREGASEVQSALNDGLAAVRENGTYEELESEWLPATASSDN